MTTKSLPFLTLASLSLVALGCSSPQASSEPSPLVRSTPALNQAFLAFHDVRDLVDGQTEPQSGPEIHRIYTTGQLVEMISELPVVSGKEHNVFRAVERGQIGMKLTQQEHEEVQSYLDSLRT